MSLTLTADATTVTAADLPYPSVFARILDSGRGGSFRGQAAGPVEPVGLGQPVG